MPSQNTDTKRDYLLQVDQGKDRIRQMWRDNCRYVAEIYDELSRKDNEICGLQETIQGLQVTVSAGGHDTPPVVLTKVVTTETRPTRHDKAPPVDSFTGEDAEITLDDWLSLLHRATEWNGWAEEEKLMQLAGYLRGSAQQEWDLLLETDKRNYTRAIQALQGKLEPVNKVLVSQDFHHISQIDHESVADFIRRLKHTFKVAYE